MRAIGDGPWPPLLKIKAQTICPAKPRSQTGMKFKIDGEVIGEVAGTVDAWWTEQDDISA